MFASCGSVRLRAEIHHWLRYSILAAPLPDFGVRSQFSYSPGALEFNLEKCSKLKFSGMLLGCPFNTLVQRAPKSQQRKILGAYCHTLNHANVLIFVIEKQFWCAYPCFEIQETQCKHYYNISRNPTGENLIWLPLQSEYEHQNVMQVVYQEKWVLMQPS